MPRGRGWPRPGRFPISVRYGPPLEPLDDVRSFSERMAAAIARLMDEDRTTWFESLRREAGGGTPAAGGPAAGGWRRVWESTRPISRVPERVLGPRR